MKHAPLFSLGIAACALVTSTLVVATPSAPPATQDPAPAAAAAADPDADLFWQMCSDCHDSARIVATRRTKPEWEQLLHKMIEEGASGTEKQFETVFSYLLRTYAKTYINSATADEIATIVGLSKKDAEAVVAARTAGGPFKDFEAVTKVPGIDVRKLEEHKDAVAF